MLNFQHKNGCKGHKRSNLEWHYIKILLSPGHEYYLRGKFHACIRNSTGLVLQCRSKCHRGLTHFYLILFVHCNLHSSSMMVSLSLQAMSLLGKGMS